MPTAAATHLSLCLPVRYTLLLATAQAQRAAKRLEDVEAGKYKYLVAEPAMLPEELERAGAKLDAVVQLVQQFQQAYPQMAAEFGKILAHVAEV